MLKIRNSAFAKMSHISSLMTAGAAKDTGHAQSYITYCADPLTSIFTFAKEVMFSPGFVCLSVCLFVCEQDNSKTDKIKFSGYVRNGKRKK